MYKVFFNDRKLFLTDNFTKHFQVKYGLFYKFRGEEDLQELIELYFKLTKIDTLYLFHNDIDELRAAFRACFIPIDAAGGLVRNTKGEFLLIQRKGRWDLPKGKLDKGETFEHAALREVEEECGLSGLELKKALLSTYHTYGYKDGIALKKTTWFEMDYTGNEIPKPQADEQITRAVWVDPNHLDEYLQQCFPSVQDVFTYYGR